MGTLAVGFSFVTCLKGSLQLKNFKQKSFLRIISSIKEFDKNCAFRINFSTCTSLVGNIAAL